MQARAATGTRNSLRGAAPRPIAKSANGQVSSITAAFAVRFVATLRHYREAATACADIDISGNSAARGRGRQIDGATDSARIM